MTGVAAAFEAVPLGCSSAGGSYYVGGYAVIDAATCAAVPCVNGVNMAGAIVVAVLDSVE